MFEMPESDPFRQAAEAVPGDAATACNRWSAHDLVAHIAAGGEEIARHVEAYLADDPLSTTRSFEDREAPYRALTHAELLERLREIGDRLFSCLTAALGQDPDAEIHWTGRQVPLRYFATHARSEMALHRWDLVGDDDVSSRLLGQPELTVHAVEALGPLLVATGYGSMGTPTQELQVRLRSTTDHPDVVLCVEPAGASLAMAPRDDATERVVTADPAARLLLLWGRRPADHDRITTTLAPAERDRVLGVLAGF